MDLAPTVLSRKKANLMQYGGRATYRIRDTEYMESRGADGLAVCPVGTREAPAAVADDKIVRPTRVPPLENKPNAAYESSRLQEVRSTEGGQEVIQRDLVSQVFDLQGGDNALLAFRVHEIVGADAEVKDIARLHAIGIVVVILLPGLWKRQQLRCDYTGTADIGA